MIIVIAFRNLTFFYMLNLLSLFIWLFSAKWQKWSLLIKLPKAHHLNNLKNSFLVILILKINKMSVFTRIYDCQQEIEAREPKLQIEIRNKTDQMCC